MSWKLAFHSKFKREFDEFLPAVRNELLAMLISLEARGPALGRPEADTLNGSRHSNMKELRFRAAQGVWRVAFAFDPKRHGILLVAGDKAGVSESKFYQRLIDKADKRFDEHLRSLVSKEK